MEGLVHDVEGDGRDQDAGPEGHDPGDRAPAEMGEPAKRGADEQRAARNKAPEQGSNGVAGVHGVIRLSYGAGAADRLSRG